MPSFRVYDSDSGAFVEPAAVRSFDGAAFQHRVVWGHDGAQFVVVFNQSPTASFTASTTDLTVDVDASGATDLDGSITSYQWDWGDGTTDSGVTASHTYNSGGDYTITLTVTDDVGATGTAQHTVSVSESGTGVSLFRVFEMSVTNPTDYTNKFRDVTLEATVTSPSGATYSWWGFFDGNGDGTGDRTTGTIWKLRFMPTETGTWSVDWRFSDGSKSGSTTFDCVSSGAGPGVPQPYSGNDYWWAYNTSPLETFGGDDPVFLKSYFISPNGEQQDVDWVGPNMYDKLIANGVNHIQMRDLLSVGDVGSEWWYQDSDAPDAIGKYLYDKDSGDPTTMRFDVWHELDRHMAYLNNNDVMITQFVGFDGKPDPGCRWKDMADADQDLFVRYVVARVAPFANIAGWNYTWETDGDDTEGDLELARLLEKYDPWNHGRTYMERNPNGSNWDLPSYTYAALEVVSNNPTAQNTDLQKAYYQKPPYLMESKGLWRSFWDASEEEVIDNMWGAITAAGSFTWNDADGGTDGGDEASILYSRYGNAIDAQDYLVEVMTSDLDWYRMTPHDGLLSNQDTGDYGTHCLADPGAQYLVVEYGGGSFDLQLKSGTYSGFWMDTHTGDRTGISEFSTGGGDVTFTTPTAADYVLVLVST